MSISAQLPSANLNISGSGNLGYAGVSMGGKRKRVRGGRASFADSASRYSGGAPTMGAAPGGLPAMPSIPASIGGRRRKQKSHKNSKRSRGGKSCKKRK